MKRGLCFAQKICLQGLQGHEVFLSDLDTGHRTCADQSTYRGFCQAGLWISRPKVCRCFFDCSGADHKLLPPLTDFITGYHFSIATMQLCRIFRRRDRPTGSPPAQWEVYCPLWYRRMAAAGDEAAQTDPTVPPHSAHGRGGHKYPVRQGRPAVLVARIRRIGLAQSKNTLQWTADRHGVGRAGEGYNSLY